MRAAHLTLGVSLLAAAAALAVALVILVHPRPEVGEARSASAILAGAGSTSRTFDVRAFRQALDRAHPAGGPQLEGVFGRNRPAEARTPALGDFPSLFPPQGLSATAGAAGVRLNWLPHPRNPVEGLSYRLVRWNPDGRPEATHQTEGLEQVDLPRCEGQSYHYRLYAVLQRPGPSGRSVRRSSPAATTQVQVPLLSVWKALAVEEDGSLVLSLTGSQGAESGPLRARPGEILGQTGWRLESFTKGETEVQVQTSIPRFDALGRRILVDGRPAFRSRDTTAMRGFATVHLLDPCGSPRRQDLLLPPGPEADGVGSRH